MDRLDNILSKLLALEASVGDRISAIEAVLARAGIDRPSDDEPTPTDERAPKRSRRRAHAPRGPPVFSPPLADDTRLTKPAVAKRYAVTTRSIERWARQPELHFPPHDIIGDRWFFWLSQLQAWDVWRASRPLERIKAPWLNRRSVA
jgi:hypothetical protein